MKNMKYLYKAEFAVIGKAGFGSAENSRKWIFPLWKDANAHFSKISGIIIKNEKGAPLIWGAMNDETESNKVWGETGRYMAGCEAEISSGAPEGWTKWIIPEQTYLAVKCGAEKYGEVFGKILSNPEIKITGTVHEFYPEPGNTNIVELYFPIASGKVFCKTCGMPMISPNDFGTNSDGSPSRDFCRSCYENGAQKPASIETLSEGIQSLLEIEAAHPNLLSDPLLAFVRAWLPLDESAKKAALPALLKELIDGQDCDFTGTRWEKEWQADGKVCKCLACDAARKCVSAIRRMGIQ